MKESTSDIIFTAGTTIFMLLTAQLGALVVKKYPETPYVGFSIMVLSILLFYASIHLFRKKKDEEKIENLKKNVEANEKLLNTINEIVVLEKLKEKIKK